MWKMRSLKLKNPLSKNGKMLDITEKRIKIVENTLGKTENAPRKTEISDQ
jgi:hypothetical protein